ncbi:MAG: LuxR family transcriptional regulator [Rhodobacteraceae bacterium]|nr:LuxR family transcriptional regulator [Paracoccaceae bacterium]MCF8516133.1 LuxR family transcriptional regulator [Paracoccaceae bacterium]MCF8520404.1 LuxR family transcriptional regulator [Paracoccaceae bacterium]
MTAVLPLLTRIAESTSVDQVWTEATAHFTELGFARANYGFTRFLYKTNVGDPDDAIYLTTGNSDYARFYFYNGFYARTPIYRWAMANTGACTWKWVKDAYEAGNLTDEEAEAVRQNAALGIKAGLSVSFPETSTRSKGALGLVADPGLTHDDVEDLWAEHRDSILAVAHMMHLRIIVLPQPATRRSLTERQRQALEWVADGKTTQDVAMLMEVSAAMVEKHLRLAREALSVETTTQAVAKASLLNLIFQRVAKPPLTAKM